MNSLFVKNFGCAVNLSDSERICGILEKAGFSIAKSESDAELVIVNTCIVKGRTEKQALMYIADQEKAGRKVVVAGCMPQAMPERLSDYSLIGVDQISGIVEVVEETLNGNTVVLIANENAGKLAMPRIRSSSTIEVIPTCSGCLGDCSYCVAKQARGSLYSYTIEDICKYAQAAVNEGAKELWLTAQDMGCYGKDISKSLPELLMKILMIPGDFRVRLGMLNPNYAMEYMHALGDIMNSPKMFRFLHIPLQSGSNEVLRKMNRNYCVEDYISIVDEMRSMVKDITIATDVICGFPEETDEQFNETIGVVQRTKPDVLHISRYWARPHTRALKLAPHTVETIKSRSRRMSIIHEWNAIEANKRWLGWEGDALVDGTGVDGQMIARNSSYKLIILEGDYKVGQVVKVKVIKTGTYDLKAVDA